jgi:hypothetical protein
MFDQPIDAQTELALASLHSCWTDLSAAHKHALDAASGLSGARHSRAVELAGQVADGLAFCRRLAVIIESDLRYEQQRDS